MALVKANMKAAIKAALLAAATVTDPGDFDTAMDNLADAIATGIDDYTSVGDIGTSVTTVLT